MATVSWLTSIPDQKTFQIIWEFTRGKLICLKFKRILEFTLVQITPTLLRRCIHEDFILFQNKLLISLILGWGGGYNLRFEIFQYWLTELSNLEQFECLNFCFIYWYCVLLRHFKRIVLTKCSNICYNILKLRLTIMWGLSVTPLRTMALHLDP